MVTTRYSNQQGSKIATKSLPGSQPPENIGILSVSRRCLWVRTTVFTTVWSTASRVQNLNDKLQKRLCDVLPMWSWHLADWASTGLSPKLAIISGQLNTKMSFSPTPHAPKNLVSRDRLRPLVPRQCAHSPRPD